MRYGSSTTTTNWWVYYTCGCRKKVTMYEVDPRHLKGKKAVCHVCHKNVKIDKAERAD